MIDLYANNSKRSVELLKDTVITIISTNDSGIEQKKIYKDL